MSYIFIIVNTFIKLPIIFFITITIGVVFFPIFCFYLLIASITYFGYLEFRVFVWILKGLRILQGYSQLSRVT
ncbi:hypothetical protein Glove_184g73 [Diversispora epigaea]|uniref:Uncharacterized protein n=1 Tax=Diversispora epigaea TaxID=1348612 RepID=A0A397IVT1_9GLOM|nr:hypothetical protein Glove_184g73 [Diversispora epigaea]